MGEKNKELLEQSPLKLLIKFSIPAIISMMVNAIYNIVDRIYIGNIPDVGDTAITGVGIVFPIMAIIVAFGLLIGVGAGAKISLKLGEKEEEQAAKILSTAFALQVIVSIILTIIGLIILEPLLYSFGASAQSYPYARDYISIILMGCVFNISAFVMTSTIRSEGNPKAASIIIGGSAVANVILDPVFIFAFGLGVKGAAIATIISQALGVCACIYYYKYKSTLKFDKDKIVLKPMFIGSIIAIGLAPFFVQIAASGVNVVANRTLAKYGGDAAIGAMAIINSIVMMVLMPVFGVNQGAQPIIGYNYGAKAYKRVKETTIYAILIGLMFTIIGALLIQYFAQPLVKVFNSDEVLVEMTTRGLRIWSAAIWAVGFSIVMSNYYQAIGKAKIAIVLSLLRQVILLIPCIFIFSHIWGLTGVWLAAPISDSITIAISVVICVFEMRNLESKISKCEVNQNNACTENEIKI